MEMVIAVSSIEFVGNGCDSLVDERNVKKYGNVEICKCGNEERM
jgi:hypothetical protein